MSQSWWWTDGRVTGPGTPEWMGGGDGRKRKEPSKVPKYHVKKYYAQDRTNE